MKNATPNTGTLLDEKIQAQPGGKSLVICGYGKCRGCNKKSPDVYVTRPQLTRWLLANQALHNNKPLDPEWSKGLLKWELRALREGLHRECQPIVDKRDRDKARAALAKEVRKTERAVVKVESDRLAAALAKHGKRSSKAA